MANRTYQVQSGDSLSRIAARFKTNVRTLQELNGIKDPNKIRVGQTLRLPDSFEASTGSYTVKSGDSLSKIAKQFGTTSGKLQELNKLADPNKLRVGQVLKVPVAAGTAPKASSARAAANGEVFAKINGAEKKIGANGRDAFVAGNGRFVVFTERADPGAAQHVHVFDVQTGKTLKARVSGDMIDQVQAAQTTDGRTGLIVSQTSGARGVPVTTVVHPLRGEVFTPNDSTSVKSVQGDVLTLQHWGRNEGEYEVSPQSEKKYDLKQILGPT